eukprot:2836878-Prymnesium_polylepis.1
MLGDAPGRSVHPLLAVPGRLGAASNKISGLGGSPPHRDSCEAERDCSPLSSNKRAIRLPLRSQHDDWATVRRGPCERLRARGRAVRGADTREREQSTRGSTAQEGAGSKAASRTRGALRQLVLLLLALAPAVVDHVVAPAGAIHEVLRQPDDLARHERRSLVERRRQRIVAQRLPGERADARLLDAPLALCHPLAQRRRALARDQVLHGAFVDARPQALGVGPFERGGERGGAVLQRAKQRLEALAHDRVGVEPHAAVVVEQERTVVVGALRDVREALDAAHRRDVAADALVVHESDHRVTLRAREAAADERRHLGALGGLPVHPDGLLAVGSVLLLAGEPDALQLRRGGHRVDAVAHGRW